VVVMRKIVCVRGETMSRAGKQTTTARGRPLNRAVIDLLSFAHFPPAHTTLAHTSLTIVMQAQAPRQEVRLSF
jgi:hypothetical protein